MSTEESHYLNVDNEGIAIVQDRSFIHLLIQTETVTEKLENWDWDYTGKLYHSDSPWLQFDSQPRLCPNLQSAITRGLRIDLEVPCSHSMQRD